MIRRELTSDELDVVYAAIRTYVPSNDPEYGTLISSEALKTLEDIIDSDADALSITVTYA